MMRHSLFKALPALAAMAALTACSVGPDFLAPEGPKTPTYLPDQKMNLIAAGIPGGEAQRIVQSMDIPGQWWGVFQSPQLNSLIERSLTANPDIRAAAASLKVAQLNARAQRATLFPTLSAGFAGTQNQTATILHITRRFAPYGRYAGLAFWLFLTSDWVADGDPTAGD